MPDEIEELPQWIRVGAELAALGNDATLVTVNRLTRTQIVCVAEGGGEYRFYRKPKMVGNWLTPGEKTPEWRQVGEWFVTLVQRDHPQVVKYRTARVMRGAARQIESSIKCWTFSWASKEEQKRPIDERAMDFFDDVENIVRAARRRVEQLNDPGGAVAEEYAQDLNQEATSS